MVMDCYLDGLMGAYLDTLMDGRFDGMDWTLTLDFVWTLENLLMQGYSSQTPTL